MYLLPQFYLSHSLKEANFVKKIMKILTIDINPKIFAGPSAKCAVDQIGLLGRFLFTKPLGLNPNLIELNELKTRVSFFLKLDNGKYCPWVSLNFRNMTSSGDVIQIKNAIFKSIVIQLVFQKCFLSLRRNTPCFFDA